MPNLHLVWWLVLSVLLGFCGGYVPVSISFVAGTAWFWSRRVSWVSVPGPDAQQVANQVFDSDENADDDPDGVKDEVNDLHVSGFKNSRLRGRYTHRVLAQVKAEFPSLAHTQANELVLDRYIRDIMREHGLRPSHIACLKPIIVALAFVPSDGEIMARQVLATSQALDRVDEVRKVVYESADAHARRGLSAAIK